MERPLREWCSDYNQPNPHKALGGSTPWELYRLEGMKFQSFGKGHVDLGGGRFSTSVPLRRGVLSTAWLEMRCPRAFRAPIEAQHATLHTPLETGRIRLDTGFHLFLGGACEPHRWQSVFLVGSHRAVVL